MQTPARTTSHDTAAILPRVPNAYTVPSQLHIKKKIWQCIWSTSCGFEPFPVPKNPNTPTNEQIIIAFCGTPNLLTLFNLFANGCGHTRSSMAREWRVLDDAYKNAVPADQAVKVKSMFAKCAKPGISAFTIAIMKGEWLPPRPLTPWLRRKSVSWSYGVTRVMKKTPTKYRMRIRVTVLRLAFLMSSFWCWVSPAVTAVKSSPIYA